MPQNPVEFKNEILKTELAAFKAEPSKENSISLLHCLRQSQVFVPGKVENVQVMSQDGKKRAQFTPSIIKTKEGTAVFTVLTSRDELPALGGLKPTGLVLPFLSVCKMVDIRSDCNLIAINPLTDNFAVSEQMYKNVIKIAESAPVATEHKLHPGEQITFFGPESADMEFAESIKDVFNDYPQIKKVYFSRMLADSQISFIFMLDWEGEEKDEEKEHYTEIIKKITSKSSPRLPLSLASAKSFGNIIDNDNGNKIKIIYNK